MPNVTSDHSDALNARLTVTIKPEDYQTTYQKELAKYQEHGHLKGFRKGKTPMSVIRKMYGKAVLSEVVNREIQNALFQHIVDEKLNTLGHPLLAEDQELVEFDPKHLQTYSVTFDLGLAPEFELKGLDDGRVFDYFKVEVPQSMIEEELDNLRLRHGEREETTSSLQENDLVKVNARELEDGKPKKDGLEKEFSLLLSNIKEEARKALLEKSVGDRLKMNIFELEKENDSYVRKYYLGLEEDDEREINPEFELTIQSASHIVPAELNEAFFNQTFGEGEVSTEAEAREKIRSYIKDYHLPQAQALLFREIQEHLLEQNPLELPDAFLKRWLVASNEETTEESVEASYQNFAENLQWTIIREKIAKQNDLAVTQEEVLERFKGQVRSYMGNNPQFDENFITNMAERLASDSDQVQKVESEILSDKLADVLRETVQLNEQTITIEALTEKLEAIRKQNGGAAEIEDAEEE